MGSVLQGCTFFQEPDIPYYPWPGTQESIMKACTAPTCISFPTPQAHSWRVISVLVVAVRIVVLPPASAAQQAALLRPSAPGLSRGRQGPRSCGRPAAQVERPEAQGGSSAWQPCLTTPAWPQDANPAWHV